MERGKRCWQMRERVQCGRARTRGPTRHQPNEKPINVSRGEGGEERWGGPLWSPASCSLCFHGGGTRSHSQHRATIKALPSQPHRPRPYGNLASQLSGLMAKSAITQRERERASPSTCHGSPQSLAASHPACSMPESLCAPPAQTHSMPRPMP